MKDEKLPTSLERVFERLDNDCDALKPFFIEEIRADLKRRGVDTASTTEQIRKLLKQAKAMHQPQSVAEGPNFVEQVVGTAAKLYRDLFFYQQQFAAGGILASASATEEEKPREIVLAEEFEQGELSRIPWAVRQLSCRRQLKRKKGRPFTTLL